MGDFKIYENMDKLDLAAFAGAAEGIVIKNKLYKVTLNGIEFKVKVYLEHIAEIAPEIGYVLWYDGYSAIESIYRRELEDSEIHWEITEGEPQYDEPKFNTKALTPLDDDQVNMRAGFFIAVAKLICNQETIEAICRAATKKKNGTLYKKRILKIAHCGAANNSFTPEIRAIYAEAVNDNKLDIYCGPLNCYTGDNDKWADDFVSTYHEGLPLSEAVKSMF